MNNKIWRIIDIINWSKEYFESNGVDSPRLTIELILSNILKLDRIQLYTNFEKPLQTKELQKIREAVKERGKRVPLQYITNQVEFYGINLYVDNNVLIPRPETEELVEYLVKKYSKDSNLEILDIGTGSGCIALSLANYFQNSKIYGIDKEIGALKVASKNKEMLNIENASFYKKDIINDRIDKQFDIIVSNPPYVSLDEYKNLEPELLFEPDVALTDNSDGLTFYRKFVTIFNDNLSNSGEAIIEIGYSQTKDILNLFDGKNFESKVIKDISGKDRILSFTKC